MLRSDSLALLVAFHLFPARPPSGPGGGPPLCHGWPRVAHDGGPYAVMARHGPSVTSLRVWSRPSRIRAGSPGPQVHHHNPAKGFSNSFKHKVHGPIVSFYQLALTPCSCPSHLSYNNLCHSRWRSRILVTRELSTESALDLHHPPSQNLPSARK
jgi:hypothetical protein